MVPVVDELKVKKLTAGGHETYPICSFDSKRERKLLGMARGLNLWPEMRLMVTQPNNREKPDEANKQSREGR